MSILVKLIADYALWLYLLLAVIAFILLRVMNLALRERTRSICALERENATARFTRAISNLLIVILLAGGVCYVSNTLSEAVPLPEVTPTPTAALESVGAGYAAAVADRAGTATVAFDTAKTDADKLLAAISETGFAASNS